MKNRVKIKRVQRVIRHRRIRAKISGCLSCPRLSVFRSSKHIWAQVIDDEAGRTILALSDKGLKLKSKKNKKERAYMVGKNIAEKLKEKGIKSVVFDRGGYKYHGRIASLAQGAREAGLKF
jgi:large subunit ribosomal protein L18